jgi:hypothetical protein
MRTHLVALAAATCLLATGGCQDDHVASAEHEPEHEHEKAGHVIPAHKPKTFPEAVRRLRELHHQIALAVSQGKALSLHDGRTLPIALDIATWLPEIAADSDMPERPWHRVNAQAGVILVRYQVLMSDRPGDSQAALKGADRAISSLEAILAEADSRWFDRFAVGNPSP